MQRDLFEKLGLLRLVEHRETGGDIGFKRELMQELGAEGVDGLDFQPAGRFQCAREQPPRRGAPARVACDAGTFVDRLVEGRIVERGPCRKRIEDALGHIRRSRLGESDAEDFFRRDAVEQEVDHPLRQHMGLARAGIGGDPGRRVRRRDRALQLAHLRRNVVRGPHSLPPRSSSRPADHSFTRARWS